MNSSFNMDITFLVIDGLNFIRRIYAAQPGDDGPERVRNALSTVRSSLARALRETGPTHAAAVFDSDEPGWRKERYREYKKGRAPMPVPLKEGLPSFKEMFVMEGVQVLSFPALEADDVIATLADRVAGRGGRVVILSTDKIFIQLLPMNVALRNHFQKLDLDRSQVKKKYGVEPERFVDLLALSGDATNNIPGVPSVGSKTAARLITEIGDLDTILAVAHTIPGKTGEMLRRHAEEARLAGELSRLKRDIRLGVNLKSFRYEPKPAAETKNFPAAATDPAF